MGGIERQAISGPKVFPEAAPSRVPEVEANV